MDKLKRAGMFGDSPGFDYLQECWDDQSLRIMIKRLIAKFPQWGFACVDEKLVVRHECFVTGAVEIALGKIPSMF